MERKTLDRKHGFTLIEITVALIIVGSLAAIAVPTYTNMMQTGMAQAANFNLELIYAAEKNYFFNNGAYCFNSPCADTLEHINTKMNLNILDNNYTYSCQDTGSTRFICYAKSETIVSVPGPHGNNSLPSYTIGIDGDYPITSVTIPGNNNTPNPSCTPSSPQKCPAGIPLHQGYS